MMKLWEMGPAVDSEGYEIPNMLCIRVTTATRPKACGIALITSEAAKNRQMLAWTIKNARESVRLFRANHKPPTHVGIKGRRTKDKERDVPNL